MPKKNKENDSGVVINKRKFFKQKWVRFICAGCGALKDKSNELHKEFNSHKWFEWEVIGNKILCAKCICALFSTNHWKN
jgi:hypothetical protein